MALGQAIVEIENGGEESTQARIERLGRQRPVKFRTVWTEIGFCFSLLASMVMAVRSVLDPIQTIPHLQRR